MGTSLHETFFIVLLSCVHIGCSLIYSNSVHLYDLGVKSEAKINFISYHENHNERKTILVLPLESIMVLLCL